MRDVLVLSGDPACFDPIPNGPDLSSNQVLNFVSYCLMWINLMFREIDPHEFVEYTGEENLTAEPVEIVVTGEQVKPLAFCNLSIVPKDIKSLTSLTNLAFTISIRTKIRQHHDSNSQLVSNFTPFIAL